MLLRNYDSLNWEKPEPDEVRIWWSKIIKNTFISAKMTEGKRVRTFPRNNCSVGLIKFWWSKQPPHHLLPHCQVGKQALGVRLALQLKHATLKQGTDMKRAIAIISAPFKIGHKKTMSPLATSVLQCYIILWQLAIQKNQSSLTQRWEAALIWVSCRLLCT